MFTGIIEERGEVVAIEPARLTIRGPVVVSDAHEGDSIAINGCCLTVVEHDALSFVVDVVPETLDKTSIGALTPGAAVNLERAVPTGGRLGGHLVQGHVDGTGSVVERTCAGGSVLLRISMPSSLAKYVASKGSVTVDGVSLTVASVRDAPFGDAHQDPSFTVSLIPTTLAETTLGTTGVGSVVNLEVDLIARYLQRLRSLEHSTEESR